MAADDRHHRVERRVFLKRAGATAAALGTAAAALPRAASAPPSERVRLAAIGIGGRANSLIGGFLERGDCDVATLCDVYPERSSVGSAVRRIAETQREPKVVQDYRRVLDDPDIDAVIVATPDHWHAPLAIAACQAGKDVYVEKPPSHNVWEGRKMVEAARRYERVVQCGTQNRSAPYVLQALEAIRGGLLGKINLCKVFNMKPGGPFRRGAEADAPAGMDWDTWLGPASARPFNASVYGGGWHMYWDFSGGDMADDGVHQLDIARWLIDKEHPRTVSAHGGRYLYADDRDVPDTQVVTFDYGDMLMTFELTQWAPYMKKTNGQIREGKSFPYWPQNSTRIELYGSKNLMVLGRHGGGWQVFTEDGKVVAQEYGRFPDPPHKENFIQCVRSRKRPSADAEEGHRSAALVHLANIAYRIGGELRFDGEQEAFVDHAEANRLLRRQYRERFAVPEVV